MELHRCAGRAKNGKLSCQKNGYLEHGGRFWCRTHHPPTKAIADETRRQKRAQRFADYMLAARRDELLDKLRADVVKTAKEWAEDGSAEPKLRNIVQRLNRAEAGMQVQKESR